MNERLLQFLAAENISQSQFAETIGVARASVSHIIAGRNRPGYDFICSILERYPSLNPEWILLGKGKMYRSAKDSAYPEKTVTAEHAEVTETIGNDAAGTPPATQKDSFQAEAQTPAAQPHTVQPLAFQPLAAQAAEARYHGPENGRTITRIVVFYSDNTFQELHG